MNLFENRNWEPMLLSEIKNPFDSSDYLFEIKFDGMRAIIFANPKEVNVYNRHHQEISNLYPELQKIKELVKTNTIFDGEIVSFVDNKPSFKKLQERSHLKNPQKIKLHSVQNPIMFVCFDILYEKKDITTLPLIDRKKILDKIPDNDVFIKTTFLETKGKKLFQAIKQLELEGIVAKEKNSPYQINTRTNTWIKIKNLKKESFVIGGFVEKENNPIVSLILGEKVNRKLYYRGRVTMGKKRKLYQNLQNQKISTKSSFEDYNEPNVTYIKPELSCVVEYLERTKNNQLRQPVFKEEEKR